MKPMANDPLNDVRGVRRAIVNECGGDPEKVFEYYRNHQEQIKRSARYQFIDSRMEIAHATTATEQSDARERD
jgi:hypothetical protein